MRCLTFDEVFGILTAVSLSSADLTRLRQWLASIVVDPAECIALIERAAAGRPCPHCGCSRKHRCGQASGLQRRPICCVPRPDLAKRVGLPN